MNFIKRLRNCFSPSRAKKVRREILTILKQNSDGLTATDVWKKLETNTDNYTHPDYVPLAEVYATLVALREKCILYNVSKKDRYDEQVSVYWRVS